jgi:hypothetical protein
MPRDILISPIDEIDFADVVYLTQVHAEEGVRLELKERLSTSNGQPDRWMRDQSGIGRVARDEIASSGEETVAHVLNWSQKVIS